jgi:ribosome-binding protein aMBF1 (putative translation factor)
MGTTEATGRDVVPGFADMIKAAREELGWSCAKLGEEAGVSANSVSAIEREVRAPSLRVASALVVALGLKVWLHEPATPTNKPKGKTK